MKKLQFKNKTTMLLAILVAIGFFLAGFMLRSAYDKQQETQASAVGDKFLTSLLAGDTASAYNLTDDTLQDAQTEEEFSSILGLLKTESPEKLEASILKGNGRTLYVQYVENLPATADGKTSGEFFITLVKDGKDWKVSTVSVN